VAARLRVYNGRRMNEVIADKHAPQPGPTASEGRDRPPGATLFPQFWLRFSRWVVSTRWVVWTLVGINLSSAVLGYIYWYGDAILASPPYFWPFVPDSPLSATLFAFALLAYYRGRPMPLLGLLAVTGCIKYGLWTDWVWFTNSLSGGTYDLEAVVLSLNHFGMVLEGLTLLPLLSFGLREVALVAAWYGANDLVDYAVGRRPRLPNPEDLQLIAGFSVATTGVLSLMWLALRRPRRSAPGRAASP